MNVVIAVNKGSVANFVAVRNLSAVHGHLRRAVNSYGQSTGTGRTGVDDEIGLDTWERLNKWAYLSHFYSNYSFINMSVGWPQGKSSYM